MRLPGAVSRLAAPFFGSQAEPSSRQRGMFRAVGGVCLAFGETHFNMLCGVVVVCPMHGVILIFARVDGEANHPSLLIDADGELHQFLWYNP